jgi:hypothetical protein
MMERRAACYAGQEGGEAMRWMPGGQGWNGDLAVTVQDQQERVRVAAQSVQRLAELGVGLADVRQSLVDRIAELPIEATWLGFERPLADLDRLALQLDTLYTELLTLLGGGEEW